MSVSLEQPMREAEIDLIELANANEAAIAQEVQDRISADTTLTNDLASEVSTREAQYTQLHSDIEDTNSTVSELGNSLNTLNTTVGNIGDRVTTVEGYFPIATANIADGAVTEDKLAASAVGSNEIQDEAVVTATIADGAVTNAKLAASAVEEANIADGQVTTIKLNSGIQSQLSFLASVPELEFGTSNSFSVQGSSYTDVDVTFTTKTEEPIVLCGLQHATGNLNCVVTAVTNQQFSARVYNLTTTDVSDVTLDWLTISGR